MSEWQHDAHVWLWRNRYPTDGSSVSGARWVWLCYTSKGGRYV